MKKFFKILRKIIKILLRIILWGLLLIISIFIFLNNRPFKIYDNYKITFDTTKKIENGKEFYFNMRNFKNLEILVDKFENGDLLGSAIIYLYRNPLFYCDVYDVAYYKNSKIQHIVKMFYHNIPEDSGIIFLYFNEDGSIKGRGSELYDENGDLIENGYMVAYHENGNILSEGNYDNGEKVGVWTGYYENGEVKSVCNYTYGLGKECYDKNYIDEVILGEQEKNIDENTEVYHINIISPLSESTISSTKFDIIGYIEDLPNSKALIYIDDILITSIIVDSEGIINQSIENINSGKHSLKITIQDIDGNILGESDEIKFYLS